jgi:hypothetical protein
MPMATNTTEILYLVQGDQRPKPTIQLTDKNNADAPIDLSAATTSILFKVRAKGATTTDLSIACTKLYGGATGWIEVPWGTTDLDLEPGRYEAEVEVSFNGEKQTTYDLINIRIREDFA